MNLFVVGDIHGCYYTWRQLLLHWQPAQERLIQLGDLVDRGKYSPRGGGLGNGAAQRATPLPRTF